MSLAHCDLLSRNEIIDTEVNILCPFSFLFGKKPYNKWNNVQSGSHYGKRNPCRVIQTRSSCWDIFCSNDWLTVLYCTVHDLLLIGISWFIMNQPVIEHTEALVHLHPELGIHDLRSFKICQEECTLSIFSMSDMVLFDIWYGLVFISVSLKTESLCRSNCVMWLFALIIIIKEESSVCQKWHLF